MSSASDLRINHASTKDRLTKEQFADFLTGVAGHYLRGNTSDFYLRVSTGKSGFSLVREDAGRFEVAQGVEETLDRLEGLDPDLLSFCDLLVFVEVYKHGMSVYSGTVIDHSVFKDFFTSLYRALRGATNYLTRGAYFLKFEERLGVRGDPGDVFDNAQFFTEEL